MIWSLLVGILVGGVIFGLLDEVFDLRKASKLLGSIDDAHKELDERAKLIGDFYEAVKKQAEQTDKVYNASLEVIKAHRDISDSSRKIVEAYRKEWYDNRGIKVN